MTTNINKEYEDISISRDDDGDYILKFYADGRNVSDFLVSKSQMEQIASMIVFDKVSEWLYEQAKSEIHIVSQEDIMSFINKLKKAKEE